MKFKYHHGLAEEVIATILRETLKGYIISIVYLSPVLKKKLPRAAFLFV
jgi:hypothetical protein